MILLLFVFVCTRMSSHTCHNSNMDWALQSSFKCGRWGKISAHSPSIPPFSSFFVFCFFLSPSHLIGSLVFLMIKGLLTEGFFWIPSLSGPTTVAARQTGSGTTWLFPFIVRPLSSLPSFSVMYHLWGLFTVNWCHFFDWYGYFVHIYVCVCMYVCILFWVISCIPSHFLGRHY